MQIILVILIVGLCALFWLNKFFPKVGKTFWKGLAKILKIIHAPNSAQQWALKRCLSVSKSGCSACDKCNSKCH